ncbi:MAG: formate--tetrahydrofolate ligase [Gammaproteobacteria bacterium]|nr:formate--tetrahydrofolate ligase [Gammaproteobacteria bacterium]
MRANGATTRNVAASPATAPEVARNVPGLRPIIPLAEARLGIGPHLLTPYGHYKAKLSLAETGLAPKKDGKLVLVTAISPTAAGEGKTTTSIGLTDALNLLGARAAACLREPSLGPCFGMKGGATGGGRARVMPETDINLHFNGDMHAISTAHNLLAAVVDSHLYWKNPLDIDPDTISWRRVMDLNDRALREVELNLGRGAHRSSGFDITAASEVMAVLCLANDTEDLQQRLGRIVVARDRKGDPVTASDLGVDGAMAAVLSDALQPNIVQTLEGNVAFIHGGPFANIAHGCNSVVATRRALGLSDVVVTEAGFGADLGAEKFLDIKCRQSGLRPDAAVLVCTVRALKLHGGAEQRDLEKPDAAAVRAGAPNLGRHVANLKRYGLKPVIAINRFDTDTDDEIAAIRAIANQYGIEAVVATHWADGGAGATTLARAVLDSFEQGSPTVELLYPDDIPLRDKIEAIATGLYGASGISVSSTAAGQLDAFEKLGYGHLPVCIAKTQYSFSADPKARGAPEGHVLPVREARLAAGAGFVVVICGDIMTMPGLPRRPAALDVGVDAQGQVTGL